MKKGSIKGLLCLLTVVILFTASACRNESPSAPATSESVAPTKVTVKQVKQWMDQGKSIKFLDSRSEKSWNSGTKKLPGALRVPPKNVKAHLKQIPRRGKLIVYCT